jgi:hypothetical protein
MAADPGAHVQAPYVTRVLGPLIVSGLPVDERTGFRILTVVSFAAAAALLYALLAEWTGSWRRALGGVAVFLAATTAPNVRDPFLIDGLSFCFILAALLLATRRLWWWLVPLAVLAVLARDSIVILLAPALVLIAIRRREARAALGAAAVAAATTWFVLNDTSLILGFDPPLYNNFSRETLDMVLDYERGLGSLPGVAFRAVAFTFGALWLAPLLAHRALLRHELARAAAAAGLLAIALAPFVANWNRSIGYAFPLVIGAVALLPSAARLRPVLALAACVALTDYWVQFRPGGVVRYGSEVILLAAAAAIVVWLGRPSRDEAAA